MPAATCQAPVSEAQFGEEALTRLCLESLRRYPEFCAELAAIRDPGLLATGTLVVARDRDDAEALDRLYEFRRRLGLDVERLRPSQARRREPALAPTVRLALQIGGDHSIDPRRLVAALADACERAGAELRRARVRSVESGGVTLADGSRVRAQRVVVAAGAHSGGLGDVPVRPVKGVVLRLRDPRGPGLVDRTIRGETVYLVPRGDGRYVLGATMEERGF